MRTAELKWQGDDFIGHKSQGIRRVYHIKSELVGNNRYLIFIQRGAFQFVSNILLHELDDAKAICQSDHESICEEIDEAVAHGMTLAATNKIHFEIHGRRLMESERAFAERNVQMFRKAILTARDNKVWRKG